ncbi:MAG: chemotaxis protein CheB [Desulfotignum sp.]|nr:chemotaxis protein CheB [Desulfotignum sp.]MCF8089772.1 chemotaxis protein CheB [Desulfotignum sp.]MCF8138617.1 chemotaxis protein CheB [Desulfotignum sp.]
MTRRFKALVIGGSYGLLTALLKLLGSLPEGFQLPVIIVSHIHSSDCGELADFFNERISIPVKEAKDKEPIQSNTVYLAPSNYHLLIEPDGTFSLNMDEKVSYSRPSIDVLFQSAGFAFGDRLIAVLMTGSNHDGVNGVLSVKKYGGLTIAQDPDSAECPVMPRAAIDAGYVDQVLTIDQLIGFLTTKVNT